MFSVTQFFDDPFFYIRSSQSVKTDISAVSDPRLLCLPVRFSRYLDALRFLRILCPLCERPRTDAAKLHVHSVVFAETSEAMFDAFFSGEFFTIHNLTSKDD